MLCSEQIPTSVHGFEWVQLRGEPFYQKQNKQVPAVE